MKVNTALKPFVIWGLFFSILFIISAFVTSLLIVPKKKFAAYTSLPVATPGSTNAPSPTPDPNNTYSVLLIGHGGIGHDGGTLADTLMLVHANIDTKTITQVSIPRDLWVSIPTNDSLDMKYKINMAFAIGNDDIRYPNKDFSYKGIHGGGLLTKEVLFQTIGIRPNHYISVDFAGLTKAIDILDGIDVVVPTTFDDYFYPVKGLENETCGMTDDEIQALSATMSGFLLEKQFPCRYEHLQFTKGKTHMDGTTALKFARSRHSDQHGGDFSRSQRQQAILLAIKDKALTLGALDNSIAFFRQFSKVVRTDIDEAILSPTLSLLGHPSGYKLEYLPLSTDNVFTDTTSVNRQYILIPKAGENNWVEVQKYVRQRLKLK